MSYETSAQDYAAIAEAYFAPATVVANSKRSAAAKSAADELLVRAEKVLPQSEAFNVAADAKLADAGLSQEERANTNGQVLAKMLTDLQIANDLLAVADDEFGDRGVATAGKRSNQSNTALKKQLGAITAKSTTREVVAVPDVPAARARLNTTLEDTFDLISKRSGKACQNIVDNALTLGFGKIAEGAGNLIKSAAEWLGKSENLGRLISIAKSLINKAYDAAMKVLGKDGLDLAENKVVSWLKELVDKRETMVSNWLEKLYQTQKTEQAVLAKVNESQADLNKFVGTINGVEKLNTHFKRYVDIVDGLMQVLPNIAKVGIFKDPRALVGLAAFYVMAFAVVSLTGAAFLDSPEVKALAKIKGVRDLVTSGLG